MLQEGDVRVTIGGQVFESSSDKAVVDYFIRHVLNDGSEANITIEEVDSVGIQPGQILKVEIVPWGGTDYLQFFYGVVMDKLPHDDEKLIIITARDAWEYINHRDIDAIFHPLPIFYERLNVYESGGDWLADLPTAEADIITPLFSVQLGDLKGFRYRPVITQPGDPYIEISAALGKERIATRFIAEEMDPYALQARLDIFYGEYDFRIVGEGPDGFPDLNKIYFQKTDQVVPVPAPLYYGYITLGYPDEVFSLTPGKPYWIVFEASTVNWKMRMFYTPAATNTGQGIASQTTGGVWVWEATNVIGQMFIDWVVFDILKEGEEYQYVPGTPAKVQLINPDVGDFLQLASLKHLRVFHLSRELTGQGVDIKGILANVTYLHAGLGFDAPGSLLYYDYVNAIGQQLGDFTRAILNVSDWYMFQLHWDDDSLPGDRLIVPELLAGHMWAGPLPAFGSPAITIAHGDDATNEDWARMVSEGLSIENSKRATGIRVLAEDPDERLLYWVRQNYDLEQQLDALSITGAGLRKFRPTQTSGDITVERVNEYALSLLDQSGADVWEGPVIVDGASRVMPGQTARVIKSRKGIDFEARILAVEFQPHLMTVMVNSTPYDLIKRFRDINRELGLVSILQPPRILNRDHTFYGFRQSQNLAFAQTTGPIEATAYYILPPPLGTTASSTVQATVLPGPTINGQPSRLVYVFIPPEGADGETPYTDERGVVTSINLASDGINNNIGLHIPVWHIEQYSLAFFFLVHG